MEFHAVPPQVDPHGAPAAPPRWEALFDAAGLTMAAFTPVDAAVDAARFRRHARGLGRAAARSPGYRVRVEAAAYRGRPTSLFDARPVGAAHARWRR